MNKPLIVNICNMTYIISTESSKSLLMKQAAWLDVRDILSVM